MGQPSTTKAKAGEATDDASAEYETMVNQPIPLASIPPPASSQGAPTFPFIPEPVTEQHVTAFQRAQQLQAFWDDQKAEIEATTDFKFHSLPLARIKKIMKADKDVKMIAGEVPVVFAKACEMFILDLTLRAWHETEGTSKRTTLQKGDVFAAIAKDEVFDFLVDIEPDEAQKAKAEAEAVMGMPPTMAVPSYVPGVTVPLGMYANQQPVPGMYGDPQPVSYMWPMPERQQELQTSDDGEGDGQD